MFASIDIFGFLFASILITPKSDTYGRKVFARFVIIGSLICYLIFEILSNIYVYYFTIFVVGIINCCKHFIMLTVCLEYLPGKETLYSGLIFFWEKMIFMISPLLFMYVSKNT